MKDKPKSSKGGKTPKIEQQQKQGKPPKGEQIKLKRNPPTCENCIIKEMKAAKSDMKFDAEVKFQKDMDGAGFQVFENEETFTIVATPSKTGCPCTWDKNILFRYIRSAVAVTTSKRDNLLDSGALSAEAEAPVSKLGNYFTINGCTLTINIKNLDKDSRSGAIPFDALTQSVILVFAARVRCNGKFRQLNVTIKDAPPPPPPPKKPKKP